jgi:hypothetical protein
MWRTRLSPTGLGFPSIHGALASPVWAQEYPVKPISWIIAYPTGDLKAVENLDLTAEWEALSDTGRWKPVIRPKVKSRTRRTGPVVARFTKT